MRDPGSADDAGISKAGQHVLPLTHREAEPIEVVRIIDPARHLTSRSLEGETVDLWDGGEAREAFELNAALPSGERHRCFLPGEFHAAVAGLL
ncbi:hypothetical protein AB0L04_01000 [Streptomyces glaucescens]|uniref:hypothetical protein n=1 Tax=Streptomyces glaucescens TaxID=1907 RepID=UPI00344DB0F0